jgi:hypothetical protein
MRFEIRQAISTIALMTPLAGIQPPFKLLFDLIKTNTVGDKDGINVTASPISKLVWPSTAIYSAEST